MERCSILLNPADVCLVMFSGGSQRTGQIKRSHFKVGEACLSSVLCCPEHLWEALVITSNELTLWESVKLRCLSEHTASPVLNGGVFKHKVRKVSSGKCSSDTDHDSQATAWA